MGFLDNSGDIILDVVLTDEGRKRLAAGDGTFNIVKFALGDDEVNYGLWVANTASAYQDLEILQTPVFEAFTNNTSAMSSRLMSIPRNNLLYLPVIKINELINGSSTTLHSSTKTFVVAVDGNTEDNNGSGTTGIGYFKGALRTGIMLGFSTQKDSNYIRIDSGIDNSAVPPATSIKDLFLDETAYTIEIDSRLGSIISRDGNTRLDTASVDDDNIALYTVSDSTDPKFVYTNRSTDTSSTQAIAGARSTYLEFRIASSINLRQSDFLFTKLGGEAIMDNESGTPGSANVRYIDTLVKITGINTGFSVDIPVRFVKLK